MGKGGDAGELWDDSALVDAFDHALATYKAMHGKNNQAAPSEKQESEDVAATAGEESVSAGATNEGNMEKDDNCTDLPNPSEAPQQPCEESKTAEEAALQAVLTKEIPPSDVTDYESKDSSARHTLNYDELLRKYYELEVQSQKVLEQLHQTNYWSYQTPEQSSAYQWQQIPAYSATAPNLHSSTIQPSCCSLNIPMVSVSCCSTGQQSCDSTTMPPSGSCHISLTCDQCPGASTTYPTGASATMHPPTEISTNDDPVSKAAMMTAEDVMKFVRSTMSGDPSSFPRNEAETSKEKNTTVGINLNLDTTGADSDLSVVLNAWYAAGFYTGRYLMQQSMKNPQQN